MSLRTRCREETISGWGRFPQGKARVQTVTNSADMVVEDGPLIGRGFGRSYGDAAWNDHGRVLDFTLMNKVRIFDREEGKITCEAGISLDEILKVVIPAGFFLPVTPGTRQVSIGGAVAFDVHGKNHHCEGSFGDYVESIMLRLDPNRVVTCSRTENRELFLATLGGAGLTGLIETVTLRLKRIDSTWIDYLGIPFSSFETGIELLEKYSDVTYTVAWMDCYVKKGSGILMLGEHSRTRKELRYFPKPSVSLPVALPVSTVTDITVGLFNRIYARIQKRGEKLVDYDSFFYPLDRVKNWNMVYGPQGFIQYQFVSQRPGLLAEVIEKVYRCDEAVPSLVVLKTMGPGSGGLLSFPMEGYTLALDFPVRPGLFSLLDELDEMVAAEGGRVYLAKDARMKPDPFRAMYTSLDEFQQVLEKYGIRGKYESRLSRRLGISR